MRRVSVSMGPVNNISLNAFCFIELRLETSHSTIYTVKTSEQKTTFRADINVFERRVLRSAIFQGREHIT